ncbi:MAG: orotate phosphoribosyltransferase [Candidatus Magasanikbacteria bacterium]|nr:orotate phosphoribosyltransferase [Candidatus Magasanikbacteria bacterium]
MDKNTFIAKLFDIGAVKFGEFKLKSGIMSPVYIDLRLLVSYPEILRGVAELLWQKIEPLSFDVICGVPYTALPIATAISLLNNKPMIMRRKEVKDYGTKKAIEGVFSVGQSCLILEDLVTSGMSVFETIEPLEHEGLKVKDIVVILDREQGGKNNIEGRGYSLQALFTMTELLSELLAAGKIDSEMHDKVKQFIASNQVAA